MPDLWSAVAELDEAAQAQLADVLEIRAAEPSQQALREAFLREVELPPGSRALDVGCGTGAMTRRLARILDAGAVVGVDPAPFLLARARALAAGLPNVAFEQADARALPFSSASFDAAVFDSTLCHVPNPEAALAEAFRVLRPHGVLAAFDGDYATTTVGLGPHDPLQACAEATMAASVNDRWLARRLPALVSRCGFVAPLLRSYAYVERGEGGYMLSIVERGADILRRFGELSAEASAALNAEARRRADDGTFFGFIAYVGVVARKP